MNLRPIAWAAAAIVLVAAPVFSGAGETGDPVQEQLQQQEQAAQAAEEAADAAEDAVQTGWMDWLMDMAETITEPAVEWLARILPPVLHVALAAIAGAIVSVFVLEALKNFEVLMGWLFHGDKAKVKMQLAAALIGGGLGATIGPESWRAAAIIFVCGAGMSVKMYDWMWKFAPVLTERLLAKVRKGA